MLQRKKRKIPESCSPGVSKWDIEEYKFFKVGKS